MPDIAMCTNNNCEHYWKDEKLNYPVFPDSSI